VCEAAIDVHDRYGALQKKIVYTASSICDLP